MISIIYCTREANPKHKEHLIKSSGLHKHVEVIEIINNGESLTKCYSRGLKQAKYNTVVFCHDDITIETKQWGKKLLKHFNNTDYGIIGIAGTTSLTDTGRWWDERNLMVGTVNHENDGKKWESKYSNSFGDDVIQTVLVDGLFFVVKKDRLKYNFDETVEGFHFYDVDFTFGNHVNGCKVGVIFNIRLTHLSVGQTNEKWEENRVKFIDKWSDKLPLDIKPEIIFDQIKLKIKREPKLSIIIPTKGNVDILTNCVNSIFDKSEYKNMEIIVADTGSSDKELDEIKTLTNKYSIKLIEYDYYNFGKINNDVVNNHISSDSELILFCNNDIELINDAISILVNEYLKNINNVGTLGARLHFGNNKIQHAGIVCYYSRKNNGIGLSHFGINSNYSYDKLTKHVIGNTGAFLMINKDLFNTIGQFNEIYEECFEDVELNIRAIIKGKKNIFVGNSVCYHYESSTRKKNDQKLVRESNDLQNKLLPFISKNIDKVNKYFNMLP